MKPLAAMWSLFDRYVLSSGAVVFWLVVSHFLSFALGRALDREPWWAKTLSGMPIGLSIWNAWVAHHARVRAAKVEGRLIGNDRMAPAQTFDDETMRRVSTAMSHSGLAATTAYQKFAAAVAALAPPPNTSIKR